jgi:small subunit ribosomal protein S18
MDESPAAQAPQSSEGAPIKRFGGPRGAGRFRRKECRFCSLQITDLNYRAVEKLVRFTTERGKIMPRRMSGNCAKHQRYLARQIKIARLLALLPFVRD